jgi:hypothetical protein
VENEQVQTERALRTRLRSPTAAVSVVVIQLVAGMIYAAFWLDPRPTQSDVRINVEIGSFFVAPFVWALLFLAGLWLLRQPLTRRKAFAARASLVVTGICAVWAIAIGALFVLGDLIFWLTDF